MQKPIPNRQNTASREKLIETAKEVFYQQGYNATTLAQISDASSINNGLITYYFGSKCNLASEIYTAFILEMRNEIARQLFEIKKGYKLELGVAVETRFMLAIKFENENLMRFYTEYYKERDSFSEINEKREHYYKLQKRLINSSISDIDLKLYEVCGISIMNGIADAYANQYLDHDSVYIEDYAIRMLYTMLQLPPYQVEALIDESRYLKKMMKIKVGPGFRLMTV